VITECVPVANEEGSKGDTKSEVRAGNPNERRAASSSLSAAEVMGKMGTSSRAAFASTSPKGEGSDLSTPLIDMAVEKACHHVTLFHLASDNDPSSEEAEEEAEEEEEE